MYTTTERLAACKLLQLSLQAAACYGNINWLWLGTLLGGYVERSMMVTNAARDPALHDHPSLRVLWHPSTPSLANLMLHAL
jgi:hypothetical protein